MSHKEKKIMSHKSFICKGDSEPTDWESLTLIKREEYSTLMMENIGETLSNFISADHYNISELEKI